MSKYAEIYNHSLDDPEAFWGDVAQGLHWDKPWDQVLDASAQPSPRWFVGGQLNTCYNALDRHIEAGNGDRLALIYDSPVTDSKRSYTYTELRDEVASLAGALTAQGVSKGDRVIVYMPMIPEAAISMLACARIGAIHSVVFGGFVAKELATRIDDSKPKMVLSASCGIEPSRVEAYKPLLGEAIELSTHKPQSCINKHRPQLAADMIDGRDLDWDPAMSDSAPVDCVPVE
ncbi:MAG: acetyl-coenzyme A synthetase N-terminal domain-containing protein, partial [Candidatus Thiodiazotropha taylori]